MTEAKKYQGRGGYHGGGRPRKKESEKTVYKTMSISGTPEEIEQLKKLAQAENKTVSRFVLEAVLKKN